MFQDSLKSMGELDFTQFFIEDDISGNEISYGDFFCHALTVANYINENVAGDSVVAVKENSYELALLYFAVMLTSKRIVVIDPQKGNTEIEEILGGVSRTGMFIDENLCLPDLKGHKVLVYPEKNANFFDNVEELKKYVLYNIQKNLESGLPYLVTFTSGTSGKTKGVEHSLRNLFLSAIALHNKVGKTGGVFLHVMPMTYMAGILNSLIYPFLIGAKIVITRRFSIVSARSFWATVVKYKADLFWLSPSMLLMIDRMDKKKEGEDYCKNRDLVFLVGTAPLTDELRNSFNSRYGVEIFASYGLSETLFISVETKESLGRSVGNSVGEILSGVEYCFSEMGEMNLAVPWMYLGYTNEKTEDYFGDEYYKSGDLAEIRENCLYITGRSKDLIIKGGMNISPALIEGVIYKNKNILENVVIGINDSNGNEMVCCVYILKEEIDNPSLFENVLRKNVVDALGKNYALDYLWRLNELPRNINGKIDKNLLKKIWEEKNA